MITIPTLSELYSDVIADIESQYGSNIPTFGKVFLRPFAAAQAARLKLYYLALGNVQKNLFVDEAQSETVGGTLERFGRVKLNRNPFPARAGEYTVEVTGTIGATIPAQTTFKSNDSSANPGKLFILDAAYTLTAATDTITVRALEAGADARMDIGDNMTATAPIANVNSGAEVTVEVTVPTDAESLENYRQVAIDAYRTEPQGGAASDYRIWSADAAGVQKVYPYAKTGSVWEINLFVEATAADSTDGKGTPSAALLSDVEDVVNFDPDTSRPLNERGRRPLNAVVNYLAITVREVDITVTGYTGLTADIQAAIEAAFETLVSAIRPYVAGADVLADKNDILDVNRIIAAILSSQPGAVFTSVTLDVDSTAYATYTFIDGDIPNLNSVTFV